MTTKMKGLLKGLRYISQIFENEEEEEFQIGLPTDVKHVAHIGCDGPAATAPSWMDEFKGTNASGGESKDGPTELTSQDSVRSNSSYVSCVSPGKDRDRDMPFLPKASRSRRSTGSESSGTKSKSEKSAARHARRASRGSESGRDLAIDSAMGSESPMRYPTPDIPKKTRRKKSKETGGETSSRPSRSSKTQTSASNDLPIPDQGPDPIQGPNKEAFEDMGDKRISITS